MPVSMHITKSNLLYVQHITRCVLQGKMLADTRTTSSGPAPSLLPYLHHFLLPPAAARDAGGEHETKYSFSGF
jgi:hypothetical protein